MMSTAPTPPFALRYDWRHPDALTRAFELLDAGSVVGSLRFTNLVGSRAQGAAWGQEWSFRRVGFFRPRIELRAGGASEDSPPAAAILLDFSGTGSFERPGTDALQWTIVSRGSDDAWGWQAGATPLMTFEHRPADDGVVAALIQTNGLATLTDDGVQRSDVPLLLLAGWYLMAAQRFDLVTNPPTF